MTTPDAHDEAVSTGDPVLHCPSCGVTFMSRPGDDCPKCGARVGERVGLPWQDRRAKGLSVLRAFEKTVRAISRRPSEGFTDLATGRPPWGPVAILATGSTTIFAGWLVYGLLFLLWGLVVAVPRSEAWDIVRTLPEVLAVVTSFYWGSFVCGLMGLFVGAVVLGVVLRLVARRNVDPVDTFAVLAYASAAAAPWLMLPVPPLNCLAAALIAFYFAVVGLSVVHKVSVWRILGASVVTGCIFAIPPALLATLDWYVDHALW